MSNRALSKIKIKVFQRRQFQFQQVVSSGCSSAMNDRSTSIRIGIVLLYENSEQHNKVRLKKISYNLMIIKYLKRGKFDFWGGFINKFTLTIGSKI